MPAGVPEHGVSVALLRGINVGGKNKVEMPRLRGVFERIGLTDVTTYINTGNVVFAGAGSRTRIEDAIEDEFGFRVPVVLRDLDRVRGVTERVPDHWVNDGTMKCDVAFLWEEYDRPEVVGELPAREGIDEVFYVPGAVVWKVERSNLTRSGLPRLVGGALYRGMTVRNINTVRRIAELMESTGA